MKFKNKQILIRYNPHPKPVIYSYLIKKIKKAYTIINQHQLFLEPYQIDNGIITDHQVIADKIINGLGETEKGVKDKIIVVYDTPDLLRFNTILPKSSLGKAKLLAKKELNDFFRTDVDNYYSVARIVGCRERGIIFYYDLISQSIINSLELVANAMNKYIDYHTNLVQGIASYFESKDEDETDTFLIYQDQLVMHIILLFRSKLVDSISYYNQVELADMVSGIELLRNKHLFAFERKETNNVILIMNGDLDKKEKYYQELKERYDFDTLERTLNINDVLLHIQKNVEEYQTGYYIKL